MVPRSVILLFMSLPSAFSRGGSCGSGAIPFRFEVSPDGDPVLGCATPQCFGYGNGGEGQARYTDVVFLREGDERRGYLRYKDASSERARCPYDATSATCAASLDWVGGFEYNGNELLLMCCRYDNLKYSAEVGRPVVHPGEVYSGGEVIRDGRQTGFDLISNIKKISGEDGSLAFELTVVRLNCLPDPPEDLIEVEMNQQEEIGRILDKVVTSESSDIGVTPSTFLSSTPTAFSDRSYIPESQTISDIDKQIGDQIAADEQASIGGQPPAQVSQYASPSDGYPQPDGYQTPTGYPTPQEYPTALEPGGYSQVGEQITPVITPGYYYPVQRCDWCQSVPACFTAEMEVDTRGGRKRMDELSIGDDVITIVDGAPLFTPVIGWQHRLPNQEATFLRIHTKYGDHVELTPLHFVWRVDCDAPRFNHNLTHAERIRRGDCFYTLNKRKDGINMQRVVKIEKFSQVGAFSPLTVTGDLVVNDIYVSCHNFYESNTAQHTLLSASMRLESFLSRYLPPSLIALLFSHSQEETHLPITTEFLLSVAESIVPFKRV